MSQTPPESPSRRSSVIQLAIKEKAALNSAYIPQFANGGLFIPTSRPYRLGDDVYVLLSLPGEEERFPLTGKVAWVTPAKAAGSRSQGIGILFPRDEKSRMLRLKIEEILGDLLSSDRIAQTL